MKETPAYYRARIAAFEQIIKEEKGGNRDDKNNYSVILRNGVMPAGFEKRINNVIQENQKNASNANLSFEEVTRFNTWFELHPEKVAGLEYVTTSREFPIMIKGTEEDIIRTVIRPIKNDINKERIKLAKAKATARKRILELIKLK
ncbi:MAG TPA: hypothetical protein P5514_12460 [Bacteroidales bacterium]|nr:hypothetical protein [Bacteroidales bacterium]HRX97751.1 hypothetical protein [Bacteroidales bacterium]